MSDISQLAALARPKITPVLDPGFAAASLVNREFRRMAEESGEAVPLVFAIERGAGATTVYRTICFAETSENASLNLPYAERIVKFLLWQRGGWRVVVAGPKSVYEHIKQAYSVDGEQKFDYEFMGGVYEHTFTVEFAEPKDIPQPLETTSPLGGHLEGNRIGFDLGATDRKVSAVMDGEPVYTEEVLWDPRNQTDPNYHYNEINAALKAAAEHMPSVDAIGGSSAGVYINNRPRVASLFRGIPKELFEEKIATMFQRLQKEWGVPLEVVNDGEVTALAGSMALGDGAVLGVAMGSSEAGGYVMPNGEITTWLNELAFCPVDYSPDAAVDEWSGDRGCGALYFSQQAVFKLMPVAGIEVDAAMGPAEKLKHVQNLLAQGNERARKILETIGVYLGYAVAHYADFYEIRHALILGRVTSGDGGNIILEKANEVIKAEFPDLAGIELLMPDEKTKRVGQAVAAASLPAA